MGLSTRPAKLFSSTNLPNEVSGQRSRLQSSRLQSTRRSNLRQLKVEQLEDRRLLATIDLSVFSASDGTVLSGQSEFDYSGFSVSDAGDVNGDGFDDVIIGAYGVNRDYADLAGKSYVVFGSATPAGSVDLSTLGQPGMPNGMVIAGEAQDFFFGTVSSAGDVNGDGFDDLIIGSHFFSQPNGDYPFFRAGKSYLLFGASTLPTTIDLTELNQPNGPTGVAINGTSTYDYSGRSVSSAGDINGDGLADVLVSSYGADLPGKLNAGKSFVIFGSRTLPPTIDLDKLGQNGQPAGLTISGAVINDRLGQSVSRAGDVNGDGFQDIILGAALADPINKTSAGKSYIVFGGDSLSATIDLANLGLPGQASGVTLNGETGGDLSGRAVSDAGDINGDGYDDVMIGAFFASIPGRLNAGKSYVVFGGPSLPTTIELSTLGQAGRPAGITLLGEALSNYSGTSVSGAGDINGDGFDDFLVGALGAEPIGKPSAGKAYLIFGDASLPIFMDLALADQAGQPKSIVISGAAEDDRTGVSVSRAGDINGDGFDDMVIGAHLADPSALTSAGKTYIIFGSNRFTNSIPTNFLGDATDNSFLGTSSSEPINGGVGKDFLFSGGGTDILLGGQGDDKLTIDNTNFGRIVGGTGSDVLVFNNPTPGVALSLDLTALKDNRILGIEGIDISSPTGSSVGNSLTLSYREVLNISDESNTLVISKKAQDTVNFGSGWTQLPGENIGGKPFAVYAQGQARLKVQAVANAAVLNRKIFYNGGVNGATAFGASTNFSTTGGNPPVTAIDSKNALLPGQNSSFANYTNVTFGINGIIVDIANPSGTLTAADFLFAKGETSTQAGFVPFSPAELSTSIVPVVTQYVGGGINGSTRAKITFNNNSLRNTWVRVTVLANTNTGLAANDVFYFGNAVGDVNGSVSGGRYVINPTDTGLVRSNQLAFNAPVTNIYDFNKSGTVTPTDTGIVRSNQSGFGILRVITGAAARGVSSLQAPPILAKSSTLSNSETVPVFGSLGNTTILHTVVAPTAAGSTDAAVKELFAQSPASVSTELNQPVGLIDDFFAQLALL